MTRRYVIKEDARTLSDFIPPVSILMGGIIFFIGTITAIFLYETPNGSYDFFNQFFSELGVRTDYVETLTNGTQEQRYAPPYPNIFNFTLVLTGILMVPFFAFSFRQMRNESKFSTNVLWISILFGVLTGPMLIGVGLFDLSYPANQIWQEHGFWVANLYLFITAASILWFFMLLRARNLPYKTTRWIWVDYVLLFLLTLFTLANLADGLKLWLVKDMPILNTLPVETYQKLIAYLFFTYFGLVVGVRLTKTKYDNTPVYEVVDVPEEWFCTNCGVKNSSASNICNACQSPQT